MAYDSSFPLVKIHDIGFARQPSSDGATPALKPNSMFIYVSSHAAEDFGDSTSFFTGVGAQLLSSTGAPSYDSITRSANNVGVVPGDIVCAIESSAGANPGRVTWHAAIRSTYGTDGFDITLSAHAST